MWCSPERHAWDEGPQTGQNSVGLHPGSDLEGPQDAWSGEAPERPYAMEEEEAACAPHGQPDLPAAPTAADGGRYPPGHGEREAGGRA